MEREPGLADPAEAGRCDEMPVALGAGDTSSIDRLITHLYNTAMESDWLALTKLAPPDARPDRLRRPRLISTLQRFLAAFPLILVSAPAGSGKTTLLASLVEETRGLR